MIFAKFWATQTYFEHSFFEINRDYFNRHINIKQNFWPSCLLINFLSTQITLDKKFSNMHCQQSLNQNKNSEKTHWLFSSPPPIAHNKKWLKKTIVFILSLLILQRFTIKCLRFVFNLLCYYCMFIYFEGKLFWHLNDSFVSC